MEGEMHNLGDRKSKKENKLGSLGEATNLTSFPALPANHFEFSLTVWEVGEERDGFLSSLVAQLVKNRPAMQDPGSIPGLGRSPGEGNGNPFQYSCLENPMDRGAWWTTIHGVARIRHD